MQLVSGYYVLVAEIRTKYWVTIIRYNYNRDMNLEGWACVSAKYKHFEPLFVRVVTFKYLFGINKIYT